MEITDIPTLRYTLIVNCLRLSRLHIFISQLTDTVGRFNDFVLRILKIKKKKFKKIIGIRPLELNCLCLSRILNSQYLILWVVLMTVYY